MKARRRLRLQVHCAVCIFAARDPEMLDIGPGQSFDFSPPSIRRKIQIRGPDKIPHAAAFVSFLNPRPEAVELGAQQVRLVEQHRRIGQQIEDSAIRPGDRRIKFPAGKHRHSAGSDGRFHHLFIAGDAPAREPRVNRAQQLLADRSLRQGQQQGFVNRVHGSLRSRIEAANGVDLVAEELDAHRALGLRRIHVENASAHRVLTRHFDHVGGTVADRVEMAEQVFQVEGLSAPQGAGQIAVILSRSLQNRGCGNRRDHDPGLARRDLPQRSGALLLQFRMGRKILERQARRARAARQSIPDRTRQ